VAAYGVAAAAVVVTLLLHPEHLLTVATAALVALQVRQELNQVGAAAVAQALRVLAGLAV